MITPRGAWSSVPYFTKYISSLVLGIGILVYLNHSEYRLEACLPALRIYSLLAIVLQVGLLFLKKAANEESIGISSSRKAKNKSYKVSDVFLIFLLSLCCVCGVHIVAVLYGAYIVENFEATLTFSIVVASLALVRPLICLGPRALQILLERLNWEEDLDLQTIAIFVGAWLGALPIPLDWDRPWQAWPLTCCIGAIFGELATSGYFLIKSFIIDPIKWKNKSKYVSKDCQELKKLYDLCFNQWFSEKFLHGHTEDIACEPVYRQYQQCVKEAIKKLNLDIPQIDYCSICCEGENTHEHTFTEGVTICNMTNTWKQKSVHSGSKKESKLNLKKKSKMIKKKKEKQSKGTKKQKTVIKNILENPFSLKLSYVGEDHEREIAKQLESCCEDLNAPSCKPPWNEVQKFKKGEERRKFCEEYRRNFMEKIRSDPNSLREYESVKEALSHLVFGYNAVMRALEKNNVAGILVKKDASLISLIEMFLPGCVNKCLPLVPLSGLDKILKSRNSTGFPKSIMVLGMKHSVKEKSCRFYHLYDKMSETLDCMLKAHHASSEEPDKEKDVNHDNVDGMEIFTDSNIENVESLMEKDGASDTYPVDLDLYHLKRKSKGERVFVPKVEATQTESLDTISLNSGPDNSHMNLDFIPTSFESHQLKPYKEKQKPFLKAFREKKKEIAKPKPNPTATVQFQFNFFLDKEGDPSLEITEEKAGHSQISMGTKRKLEKTGNEKTIRKKKKNKGLDKSGNGDQTKRKEKQSLSSVTYSYIPAKTKRIKNNPNRGSSKNI